MTTSPPQRVAPPLVAERWDLPGKPPDEATVAVLDAYRQTRFQLGGDLRLLHEGMNLQLRVAHDSSPSKFRTHALAAGLMLWSRAFGAIADGATAIVHASYGSVPPLARMACECLAAAYQASGEEQPAFAAWLAAALAADEREKATDVGVGAFMAGSTIAADAELGAVYRAASEFARPHFGVALALTASESNRQRVAPTFGDQSFHFGWAQLTLGWLLALTDAALRLARTEASPYAPGEAMDDPYEAWATRMRQAIDAAERCRVREIIDDTGERRWLIENFRRQSGGAGRRLLL